MQHGHGRVAERLHLGRDLMTMAEALDKMRSDHAQEFLVVSRHQVRSHVTFADDKWQSMIQKGQLLILDDSDLQRHIKALALYERVRDRVTKQLVPVRQHLKELIGDATDVVDDDDETPERTLSQQERDRRQAMANARTS
jgi:E3 ubiquitin-protein ligase SHPRH